MVWFPRSRGYCNRALNFTDNVSVDTPPVHPDPAVSPRIECRRCGTGFVCEWPELSGAVHCPVCDIVASLSNHDTEMVVDAAGERRRRGMPTRWSRDEIVLKPHAEATEEEIREVLRIQARRIRRNADRLCPNCLYNIDGLFEGWDQVKPCPECAEPISPRLVVERWIERPRQANRHANIAMGSGMVAGLLFPLIAMVVGIIFADWLNSGLFALLILSVLAACSAIIVYRHAIAWMRLRYPVASDFKVVVLAMGILTGNVVNAIFFASLFGLPLTRMLFGY